MFREPLYRNSLGLALILHLFLLVGLVNDKANIDYAVKASNPNQANVDLDSSRLKEVKSISAVSIDADELNQAVSNLQKEKLKAKQAELAKQNALQAQAKRIKNQRLAEEKKLKRLRKEAAIKAALDKKRFEEQAKKMQRLKAQKRQEEKQLAELKRKQSIEKQRALEKERMAKESAQRKAEFQKQAAAEKKARILSMADKYKILIVNAISKEWILPENIDKSLSSQFEMRIGPDGSVLDVRLSRSSGDPILDRSAQTAIYKASPLPVPTDPEVFEIFRRIRLTVRPENVRG